MVFKNTVKSRKLVKELSDFMRKYTEPFYRPVVDKGWNCGEDIRFEIGTVGDYPVIISTAYTPESGFWFKVRILSDKIENDTFQLFELSNRLISIEPMLERVKELVENAQPEPSTCED